MDEQFIEGIKETFGIFMTAAELASLLKMPRKSVYQLQIPQSRPTPHSVRFLMSDVIEYLQRIRRT